MHTTRRTTRRFASGALAVALVFGGGLTACSDEDGDGANTDEEVEELDEGAEDVQDQVEEEIDEGQDETDDGDDTNG